GLGYMQQTSFRRCFLRELMTSLILAVVTGVAAGVAGNLIMGAWQMGVVVTIGMFCAVSWGTVMGTLIPMIFEQVGVDPAVASGPLVATFNDAVAVTIYLGLGALLLPLMGMA
ncbi:MAG: magnesium transporter, partial [Armatimonadota bacterium]